MTDDTIHPDDVEDRSDAHQQAVEACRHAVDALPGDGLPPCRSLLDKARAAAERAQHDDTETQLQHETVYDCYG
jgi:hypothetical protein